MKRGGALPRRTPLKAKTRLKTRAEGLRHRSAKAVKLYAQRRPFVARQLAMHPFCQACPSLHPDEPPRRSVDVHERLTRARLGDVLDPLNTACLCRRCHDEIHTQPARSAAQGWLEHSWHKRED